MFISNSRLILAILATSSFSGAAAIDRIAGYMPSTDVSGIAAKDLIQKELQTIMGDEECNSLIEGEKYYNNGDGKYLKNLPTYKKNINEEVAVYTKFYGDDTFYDSWVQAAFAGQATDFANGNADFSAFPNNIDDDGGCVGQEESVKKATAYTTNFVEVMQFAQLAYDNVDDGCISQQNGCTDALNAWDSAVATFAGSLEGTDGGNTEDGSYGYALYALADKRCDDYEKCGPSGKSTERTEPATINIRIMELFAAGSQAVYAGDLPMIKYYTKTISEKIGVPLVQGTLRYAYRMSTGSTKDKEVAEGGVFAFGAFPKLWKCSKKGFSKAYTEMKIGGNKAGKKDISFDNVKNAFECNYKCMGIRCDEVGSLYDGDTDPRSVTCVDPSTQCKRPSKAERKKCRKFVGKPGIKPPKN